MPTTTRSSIEAAFGRTVRTVRTARGLSQEQLAHDSGLHRTFISQIERGIKSPSLASMQAIATALTTPLDVLMREALASPAVWSSRERRK